MRYRSLIVTGLALALMGQGCMAPAPTSQDQPIPNTPAQTPPDSGSPQTDMRTRPRTLTVEMKDNVFSPQIISVNIGDTVVWKNTGKNNHTTTGLDGPLLWDSGNIAPGQSYSRLFDQPGTYSYHCGIHPDMKGTVIVGEVHPGQ